jgi:hypothetical protein
MKRDGWSGSMQVKIFSISLHLLFYQCLRFFLAVSDVSPRYLVNPNRVVVIQRFDNYPAFEISDTCN